MANLKHLAAQGTLMPPINPRLISQEEAAEMIGVSYSNFKKLEREGKLSFKRRMDLIYLPNKTLLCLQK